MNEKCPPELVELQESVAEIFWYVKRQADLAGGNLERKSSPLGDADETERGVHGRVLALGRDLMGQYFVELGPGDLGYRVEFGGQEYTRQHRERGESILTVFGPVPYKQSIYYCGDGNSVRPLEAMANLPERRSTYLAQELMARLGIEDTYGASRSFYADFFGHSLSPRTIEEVIGDMAESYQGRESAKPLPELAEEGKIGVVSFDGKGIPVVPSERTTGKTREALLGCVYTAEPKEREAEKIAYSLVMPELLSDEDKEQMQRQSRARNIQYHGSVANPKEEVFSEVREAATVRFAACAVTAVVCLMDGASVLWRLAKKHFSDATYILDIMHVLKYLWQAALALKKGDREQARVLVCAYLITILRGRVGAVIGGLRIRLTKNRICGQRRKDIQAAITYLENHRDYMRYDQYLAAGYPIATGVIESACGHLVKDRMDKAGAQWRITGAESVLKLRCVRANDDWHDFQQRHKRRERARLYALLLENAA